MTATLLFVAVLAVGGCHNPRQPTPNICFGSCPRVPDLEPLGKLCTLDSQACLNGILTCYYKCVDVESERPLDVEIRSTPRDRK
jgi:hypothetical protein